MDRIHTAMIALIVLWLGIAGLGRADTVAIPVADGISASADYHPADPGRPAVLLLHGFLQTRYATTIPGLKDSLTAAGYSVLTPTLSLGIDQRRRSLACEAAHTHTMGDDTDEIGAWLTWLRDRGHQRVVLIGHSFGSLHVLAYLLDQPDPMVVKSIAISLVDLEHGTGASRAAAEVERALKMQAGGDETLSAFEISYCKRYVAPPTAFLSYATWSKQRILDSLDELPVPLEVVMGGSDQRMDPDWPQMLAEHGVRVATIDGANHFFDGIHELDLAEKILESLHGMAAGP